MTKIIDLTLPNLREVAVGSVVRTSKGTLFELISRDERGKEIWLDKTSGIIWGDAEDDKYNHHDAVEKFGDKLPTKEEFEIAEEHGFREVLPNIRGNWFWSGSVNPVNASYAYFFNGGYGVVGGGDRSVNSGSVRCVSR